MNKLFLFSALLVFACASLHAQVTIGALEKPHAGAVLDLNSSVKGGLTLSNVALPDRYTIPSTFPGMDKVTDLDKVKANFAGALVYHTGGNNIPSGVYVWNGTIWLSIEENCTRLDANKLNVATSFGIVEKDDEVTFTVSSGASPACAEGEVYDWYVDGYYKTTTNYSSSPYITKDLTGGPHRIGVEASNLYDYDESSSKVPSNEVIVYVKDSGTPTPYDDDEDEDDDYVLNGNICYDVKGPRNESTESQVNYDLRVNAFAKSFEKTFRFDYKGTLTSLSVLAPDPGSIIASVTQPARTFGTGNSVSFTATFVESIRDQVLDITTGGPKTAKLWVGYITSDSPTAIKFASLNITVQDADCHCPVRVSSDKWLTFMCRDLGATKNIRSLEDMNNVTQDDYLDYHGDWYKFGAAPASLVNNAENAALYPGNKPVNNWKNLSTGTWDIGQNKPCPDGWRVPEITEWRDVMKNNTQTFYQGTTVVNQTIWGNVNTNTTPFSEKFNRMVRIGDLFFFPAGTRGSSYGELANRFDYAHYWSSTKDPSGGSLGAAVYVHSTEDKNGNGWWTYINSDEGCTVRCVAAQ